MEHLMRILLSCLITCLTLVNTTLTFAEEIFPPACKPFVIKTEAIHLPEGAPRLIMLHNLSELDLWITHPVSEANAAAGWSSRLQSGQWSALALDKTAFELSCIESKPGHEQQISCEHTLATCEWPITSSPEHTSGIFWAGENMSLSALTAYLGRRGFGLPSQAQ
jgi:hypothetical protein